MNYDLLMISCMSMFIVDTVFVSLSLML